MKHVKIKARYRFTGGISYEKLPKTLVKRVNDFTSKFDRHIHYPRRSSFLEQIRQMAIDANAEFQWLSRNLSYNGNVEIGVYPDADLPQIGGIHWAHDVLFYSQIYGRCGLIAAIYPSTDRWAISRLIHWHCSANNWNAATTPTAFEYAGFERKRMDRSSTANWWVLSDRGMRMFRKTHREIAAFQSSSGNEYNGRID